MSDPCTSTPLISKTGVRYWEETRKGEPETAKEFYGKDNSMRAVRVLTCAWTDRLKLVRELKGGISGTTYTGPDSYPDVPTMLVSGVAVEGLGIAGRSGARSMASYQWAILTVEYETPTWQAITNTSGQTVLLTESMDYNAEFITLPDGMGEVDKKAGFVWTSDSTPLSREAIPAKIVGMAEYTIQVHRHPQPPWTSIGNCLGHVHNGVFAPLSRSFGDGYLVFLGSHDDHQFFQDPLTGVGVTLYNLTYKFAWRQYRWNTAYRPKTGTWEDFQTSSGGHLYESANFMTLFGYT